MSGGYRDQRETIRARITVLDDELTRTQTRIAQLDAFLATTDLKAPTGGVDARIVLGVCVLVLAFAQVLAENYEIAGLFVVLGSAYVALGFLPQRAPRRARIPVPDALGETMPERAELHALKDRKDALEREIADETRHLEAESRS
ncbi:MAG TPA: hypothetical protein VF407_25145 [Polyangiaceae bacterium]